jgi:hypothetical protein
MPRIPADPVLGRRIWVCVSNKPSSKQPLLEREARGSSKQSNWGIQEERINSKQQHRRAQTAGL